MSSFIFNFFIFNNWSFVWVSAFMSIASVGHAKSVNNQNNEFTKIVDQAYANAAKEEGQVSAMLEQIAGKVPLPTAPLIKGKSCGGRCKVSNGELFPPPSQPADGKRLYVFVSLTMPSATLKALYREVDKINGQLVVRGLVNNCFKATKAKIDELGIALDIDPPLFEEFAVKRVPTFVYADMKQGKPLATNYDRVEGNLTVGYTLKLFKEGTHA